ncbi:sterigmatocystin biosynthesis P450 monooxygenase StcS [Biscogniauxia marginata]|nr:sterigmatocystin biosynthesis P450 monooxygenase StcS [Biscogniauxia marginata]
MSSFCNMILSKLLMPTSTGLYFATHATLLLLVSWLAKLLLQGALARARFLKMRARGIPIMEPYSPLFGHLPLMRDLRRDLPTDAHSTYINVKIARDWKLYFPSAPECPPVIYIDLWPIMPQPFILIISPQLCSQLTQETPQPRHAMFKWAQIPLTDGLDLLSMDQTDHKLWRSRLNPGFSSRNLAVHVPALIEEVSIFTTALKSKAGEGRNWGEMFTLYDKAIALTFDVIMRIATGLRIHEQTSGPEPILVALRSLIACCKFNNIKNRLERLTPTFNRVVSRNTKIIRDFLYPQIVARLSASTTSDSQKTVVDLAIKEVKEENQRPNTEFIDSVIANLKIFLFAGHDTTAQTLSWIYYEINRHPSVLAKIRAEHDEILGKDPKLAMDVLLHNHHKSNELRYTSAAIKETLRLHTPAGTLRQASPGFHLVLNGVEYPTYDAVIQTVPSAIHVHQDYWPQAMESIPERFLVSKDHVLYPVKNAWRPFELSSTRCIGEELAMMEMKLALVFTLRELDFDFNYVLWDKLQGREASAAQDLVNGQRAYRSGQGIGHVKDYLPTRVRLRSF